MRRARDALLLIGTILFLLLRAERAPALVRTYDLAEMARASELIVAAEVVDRMSYRAPLLELGEVIFTDVTLRVTSVLKGALEEDEVTVQVLGGEIGDVFQRCPDSPRYRRGEDVLVFLRQWRGRLWNVGWFQGKYRLSEDGRMVKGDRRLPIATDTPLEDVRAEIEAARRPVPSASTPPRVEVWKEEASAQEKGGAR